MNLKGFAIMQNLHVGGAESFFFSSTHLCVLLHLDIVQNPAGVSCELPDSSPYLYTEGFSCCVFYFFLKVCFHPVYYSVAQRT